MTETVCDLANSVLSRPDDPRLRQPHRLEAMAATPPTGDDAPSATPGRACLTAPTQGAPRTKQPVAAVDVYVDDFLLLAQTQHQQQRVMRAALHSIDRVLRPLSVLDPPERKEPASVKKCSKAMLTGRRKSECWDGMSTLPGSP